MVSGAGLEPARAGVKVPCLTDLAIRKCERKAGNRAPHADLFHVAPFGHGIVCLPIVSHQQCPCPFGHRFDLSRILPFGPPEGLPSCTGLGASAFALKVCPQWCASVDDRYLPLVRALSSRSPWATYVGQALLCVLFRHFRPRNIRRSASPLSAWIMLESGHPYRIAVLRRSSPRTSSRFSSYRGCFLIVCN